MFDRLRHRRRTAPAATDVCPGCRTSFVCPVDWGFLAGGDQVWILLRCGQCEDWRNVTVSTEAAERCSRDLERARSHIAATLQELELQRMEVDVTTFVTALDRDLIDAADFRPRRP